MIVIHNTFITIVTIFVISTTFIITIIVTTIWVTSTIIAIIIFIATSTIFITVIVESKDNLGSKSAFIHLA